MEAEELQPWQKQEGESNTEYAKYLVYQNMGPGRTVLRAYRAYKQDPNITTYSGAFRRLSTVRRWIDRASAYDVYAMSDRGTGIVVNWVEALVLLSERTLSAIIDQDLRPKNLEEALRIIDVLSQFVTPETVQAAREFAAGYFARQRPAEPETG